jgi:hypothetical protein
MLATNTAPRLPTLPDRLLIRVDANPITTIPSPNVCTRTSKIGKQLAPTVNVGPLERRTYAAVSLGARQSRALVPALPRTQSRVKFGWATAAAMLFVLVTEVRVHAHKTATRAVISVKARGGAPALGRDLGAHFRVAAKLADGTPSSRTDEPLSPPSYARVGRCAPKWAHHTILIQ